MRRRRGYHRPNPLVEVDSTDLLIGGLILGGAAIAVGYLVGNATSSATTSSAPTVAPATTPTGGGQSTSATTSTPTAPVPFPPAGHVVNSTISGNGINTGGSFA
jgi:hypothetical protein